MTGIMPSAGVPASQTQNALANPLLTAGCQPTWYAPRCNPKFDPFAANAVLSEIINFVNCCTDNPLRYDCTRLDNMCRAFRHNFNCLLGDCLDVEFPNITNACSVEFLVLATDDEGCTRIARYSEAAALAASAGYVSVAAHLPPNTAGFLIPDSFPNPALYYSNTGFIADGGVDPNQGGVIPGRRPAPGLNEATIQNSRFARVQFTTTCVRSFEVTHGRVHAAAADANTAYLSESGFTNRVRVNGGPWQYNFAVGSGNLVPFGSENGVLRGYSHDSRINNVPAGVIEIEWFYLGPQTGNVHWNANTNQGNFGVQTPVVSVRQAI